MPTEPHSDIDLVTVGVVSKPGFVKMYKQSVLHFLDRWQPNETEGYYFDKAAFDHPDQWKGIPVVFAKEHPDLDAFSKDPEAELARIGGEIVGYVSSSWVESKGKTRLMASIHNESKEVDRLYNEGRLGLSTGMYITYSPSDRVVLEIEPNHLLIFEETNVDLPQDKGAVVSKVDTALVTNGSIQTMKHDHTETTPVSHAGKVVSKANEEMLEEILADQKGVFDRLRDFLKKVSGGESAMSEKVDDEEEEDEKKKSSESKNKPTACADRDRSMNKTDGGISMTNELTEKYETIVTEKVALENKVSELQTAIGERDDNIASVKEEMATIKTELVNKDAIITEKDTEIAELKNKVAEFENAKNEAEFAQFLETVPIGHKDTDEKKTALKNKWDNDPRGLVMELATMSVKTPPMGKVGSTNMEEKQEEKPEPRTVLGTRDPTTGEWA